MHIAGGIVIGEHPYDANGKACRSRRQMRVANAVVTAGNVYDGNGKK
ncbi:MAG: hypothetical protein WCP86_03135 [bacterium]